MIITPATLSAIAQRPLNPNMVAMVAGLVALGSQVGLDRPARLARYLGQTCHESMGWTYDREIWGNTPAQVRYDTRTDLGNSPAADGDGYLYRGRTGIQITGKANYRAFRDWCRAQGLQPWDFEADPERVLSDPWEGLGPAWYWATCRRKGLSLNDMADRGDDEAVTRAINGGTNGLADRLACTLRAGLVLLAQPSVVAFQRANQLTPDGVPGPITRGMLHKRLTELPPVQFKL